ncbi:MAG: exosome complex RNA-binding protein Csl4 [Thermoplasmata archaeon]
MTPAEIAKLVVPGEYLGTAEEFVPGPGTYEDGGRIFAALFGTSRVDPHERAIAVDAVHAVPKVKEGDLVYARVDEIKTAMAICTVLASVGSRRGIPGAPEGTVHVSKAKDGYTESLNDEFAPGDVLLARVLQSHPSIKLTTAPTPLGVVAARCQVCHGPLVHGTGRDLVCPRCGHHEHRKIAESFGLPPHLESAQHAHTGV